MKLFLINDNSEDVKEIQDSDLQSKLKDNENKHAKLLDYCNNTNRIIYNIATVSDKPINCRLYPDQHIRSTVEDKLWTTPYSRPLLQNHDSDCEPLGRVITQSLYVHKNKSIDLGDKIPQTVIDALEKKKLFKDGTSSVILGIKASNWIVDAVEEGHYLTTSQGSATDSLTCSICGEPISSCEHYPGRKYDDKTCYAVTGQLHPYEVSIVNEPANDTSLMIVYDPETNTVKSFNDIMKTSSTKDNIEPENIIKDSNEQPKGDNKTMDLEKLALSILKIQKDKLMKQLTITEDELNEVMKEFNLENLADFIALTDLVITKNEKLISDKTKELIDSHELNKKELTDKITELETKVSDLEAEKLSLADEVKTEPEVKEEPKIQNGTVVTGEVQTTNDQVKIGEPEVKDTTEDLTPEPEQGKIIDENKIPDFTGTKTEPELKKQDSIVLKFLNNKKSIAETF